VGKSADIGLPGYRDFVLIARSESSEVYRAQQQGVERPVAVKVLLLDDPDAVARFERELDITVTLGRRHPNIVNVIDIGTTTANRPCIIMEYYELGSLQDRLRARGPLAWGEVLAAGTVVADALSFAHGHGLLHRDIKPANVLCLPTSYVLADFGIARPVDATHTSSVEWFSVRHASPQVIDGGVPTVADDIWSVGSTLFTLLDGRPPFAADSAEDDAALAYMRRVRTERPRVLQRPDVPPGLMAIIDRCLRLDQAQRYPDAAALLDALRSFAGEARVWAPVAAGGTAAATDTAYAEGLYADGPREVTIAAQAAPVVPVEPLLPFVVPPPQPPAPDQRRLSEDTSGATVAGVLSPLAMADLVASMAGDGGYSADETGGHTSTTEPRRAATRVPRRVSRLLRLVVIGLLLGGIVGVVGTVAVHMIRAGVAETAADPARSGSVPSGRDITNPLIAPTNVEVEETTTGVLVRWQDPTGGAASFYLVRMVGDQGDALQPPLTPGTTQAVLTLEQLGPAGPPYCFSVVAVMGRGAGVLESGVSEVSCSTAG
jgi:hypothetical protein